MSRTQQYILCFMCFVIELGSVSFLRKLFGIYTSPILFLLSSVLLTLYLVKIAKRRLNDEGFDRNAYRFQKQKFLVFPIFFLIVFVGWLSLRNNFSNYPIDPKQSDIIPLIKVLVNRLSSGQKVYTEITEFGYTMYPNYLPMTWLPFTIAQWLHLDYRTWSYLAFSGCIFLCLLVSKEDAAKKILFIMAAFITFYIFLQNQPSTFGWTVEPMIAGYYLLLLYGLYKQNIIFIVVGLICCLLSRYAIVLLLPFLALTFFYFGSKKKMFFIFFSVIVGILILFVLPFLIQQPEILSKGYDYYTKGALAEWKGQSWQQPGVLPYQLFQGYGFAIFFYQKNDIQGSLYLLQKAHLIVSFLVPLILFIWYFKTGKHWLPANIFLVLMMNLYLIFFFAFIQVPYAYLFFTPLILSATSIIIGCFYPLKK